MRTTSLLILTTMLCLSDAALAQDNNYWTLQYGNQARLLGGAVIGSATDLSAVYYNPGRLAMTERPEFVIAGNVVEFTSTALEASGTERSSGKTRFSLAPSLFAGELKFGFLGKGRLAYSFLARQYSELRLQAAFIDDANPDGVDFSSDLVKLDHRLSEYWGGFTYSRMASETIGIGASMFITSRTHRTGLDEEATLIVQGQPFSDSRNVGYEYSHWGVLWKLGAGTRIDDWDIGITLTTPRIKILGDGDVYDSRITLNEIVPGRSFVDVQVETGLSTRYKSPWSVAFGGSNTFGANSVHVGVEWFASIAPYTVLDAAPQPPQVGGPSVERSDLVGGSGDVVNFAVGFQRRQNERLRWYASVHSDFAAERPPGSNLSFTAWDLWHFGGGASFVIGTTEVTLGAIYASGGKETAGSFENIVESRLHRMTLILGFNLPFGAPQSG